MGAYSPASWISPGLLERIEREIVAPTLTGFSRDGLAFRGVLFIGVMVTPSGPKVLEFNVRFGDPETEVLLPRLEGDVLDLLHATASGRLDPASVRVSPLPSLCVVIAAGGYPGVVEKGVPISLPSPLSEGVSILHAGTASGPNGTLVSNGGRVLCVSASGPTLQAAADAAYAACDAVVFDGCHFRRDIGWQELRPA
jgi:phosphoribosylamine--glycine ligase